MPFSAGVHSLTNNFVTEAASPPIEIAKLDTTLTDISNSLSVCLLRDGTGLPTSNLPLNNFTFTGAGAATTLTGIPQVTQTIAQRFVYYVDSGSANVLVITPSPAISAYAEGQRFVVRATAANSGATTLNVNGLGAIAVQTPDGAALSSGAIVVGGIYEFTYDANASPDRWVLTSMPSDLPDGMLSSNVPLKNTDNAFSRSNDGGATQSFTNTSTGTSAYSVLQVANSARRLGVYISGVNYSGALLTNGPTGEIVAFTTELGTVPLAFGISATIAMLIDASRNFNFYSGTVTTNCASASEVGRLGTPQSIQDGNYTLVITDAGKSIDKQAGGAGETITIPSNASVPFGIGTIICGDNDGGGTLTIAITSDVLEDSAGNTGSRTVADNGSWQIKKIAVTKWRITGIGIS